MESEFQVTGRNDAAQFTLKLHRGDGMTLLAMNWRKDRPPSDFVGFAIEYKEPSGHRFFALKNRLAFDGEGGAGGGAGGGSGGGGDPDRLSTRRSPIQKFRWVHFPRNADLAGEFVYRVSPVFMNGTGELSYGDAQEAAIELRRETYPGRINVAFTRGFVSSQAFVERYESKGPISKLLPKNADAGWDFVPTHPDAKSALRWMGFEAREAILDVLDEAIGDKKAEVRVVAYDLSEPEVVSRLEKLGGRLKVIIDDDKSHGEPQSAETRAAARLATTAGPANVKRQHMGKLQHNKTIVVDGPNVQVVVCGSTNFTWRGLYVQANNALVLRGKNAVGPFLAAFDSYWAHDEPEAFGATAPARWRSLGYDGISARVTFSPHGESNAALAKIAEDIRKRTRSSLLYSLAFLYQTEGPIRDAIEKVTEDGDAFVYGISDRKVGGIDLQKPDGNVAPVYPAALTKDAPAPFKAEPTGGGGNRMHHKFVVIDFDKPSARVYLGSYNFSGAADTSNGEQLVLIRDRRIAVSYAIEAVRLFDHYHFRVSQAEATAKKPLELRRPPRKPGDKPWWTEHYTNARKIRDRELFA